MGLVSVLGGARLHLGGDSGGIHLAVMANAPTVSWFRMSESVNEWAPHGKANRVIVSPSSEEHCLCGINIDLLIEASIQVTDPSR